MYICMYVCMYVHTLIILMIYYMHVHILGLGLMYMHPGMMRMQLGGWVGR